MSSDEQRDLCARAQAGDIRARNRLVEINLPYVRARAKKLCRDIAMREDAVQDGVLGIVRAIEKFDLTKPVKFLTYATFWIDHHIRESVIRHEGRSRAALEKLRRDTKDGKEVAQLRNTTKRSMSLDTPITSDSESLSFKDMLVDDSDSADERLAEAEMWTAARMTIANWRKRLNVRDRSILDQRVLAEEPKELRELGVQLSLSHERVRQLEVIVRRRLTGLLRSRTPLRELVEPTGHAKYSSRPRRICVVCGIKMRGHNRHDRCAKHGYSFSFDAATGICIRCKLVVPALQRGAHALRHVRGEPMDAEEIRRRNRTRTATLRDSRKHKGQCLACGKPVVGNRLCGDCIILSRKHGANLRRRRGVQPRQYVTLVHEGEALTLAGWARRTGIEVKVLWGRWHKGLSVDQILTRGRLVKSHCVRGHALTAENVWLHDGRRYCRSCMRQRCRDRRAASRAASRAAALQGGS